MKFQDKTLSVSYSYKIIQIDERKGKREDEYRERSQIKRYNLRLTNSTKPTERNGDENG
jgi:hypothetical protein